MFSPEITFTYTLFASVSLYFNVRYGQKIVNALPVFPFISMRDTRREELLLCWIEKKGFFISSKIKNNLDLSRLYKILKILA